MIYKGINFSLYFIHVISLLQIPAVLSELFRSFAVSRCIQNPPTQIPLNAQRNQSHQRVGVGGMKGGVIVTTPL